MLSLPKVVMKRNYNIRTYIQDKYNAPHSTPTSVELAALTSIESRNHLLCCISLHIFVVVETV